MSELSSTEWVQIRDHLATQCGLYLDDSRQSQGRSVLLHRARLLGLAPPAYAQLLLTSGGTRELGMFAEQLANHETQFLRNPAHFRALREQLLPDLDRLRPAEQPLRCWSAGCATGEEAYGIALMALQTFGWPLARRCTVYATDLSQTIITQARRGEFRGRTLTNLGAHYTRWFEPLDDGGIRAGEILRSLVQFEQHNLLNPWPAWTANLDVIFCQNVTIYFQLPTCQRLIERLYAALADGGYLLLGFSESLWGIFDGFETLEVPGGFVYRKPATRSPSRPIRPMPPAPPMPDSSGPEWPLRRITRPDSPPAAPRTTHGLIEEAQRLRTIGDQRTALDLLAAAASTPGLLALAAQLHADLGETEQASAEARRALELDVMQETAYLVLGVLEVQSGAFAEGAQLLERAQYLMPASPQVSFYLAESYRQLGRTAAARREYRNTIRKLADTDPGTLIDGVAAGWLSATCQRWLSGLED